MKPDEPSRDARSEPSPRKEPVKEKVLVLPLAEGNALKQCEEATESGAGVAESVNVLNVNVNGESAPAEAEQTGGGLDGQVIEVGLVEEGGDRKMNELLGSTKFDGRAFAETLEAKLAEEEGVGPELAKCVSESVGTLSQEEAEMIVFEKNLEPLEEAAGGCE